MAGGNAPSAKTGKRERLRSFGEKLAARQRGV
jgi:hypothetical protein